jgi:hypothetical protein
MPEPSPQNPRGEDVAEGLRRQAESFRQQAEARTEELAAAEAQRDEANLQLTVAENRLAAERVLGQAGVIDVETASLLLGKRVGFEEALTGEQIARAVETLLLDKPFLHAAPTAMPPVTSSPREPADSAAAQLARTARRAAASGNRKDIAEYLRLRRRAANMF